MAFAIPATVKKYFWGDSLHELSWSKHKKYIIQTLLEKGDRSALRWLSSRISRKKLKNQLPALRLQKKSSNFWRIYFS